MVCECSKIERDESQVIDQSTIQGEVVNWKKIKCFSKMDMDKTGYSGSPEYARRIRGF
jgi:hypothetical protein